MGHSANEGPETKKLSSEARHHQSAAHKLAIHSRVGVAHSQHLFKEFKATEEYVFGR